MEDTTDELQNARNKAEKFFNQPKREKTELDNTLQDRLKSLKEQLQDESNTVEPRESTELQPSNVQTFTKPIITYGNFSDVQLEFLQLMIPMRFHITQICHEVGVSRRAYYNWIDDTPGFKEAVDDKYEYITDVAEAAVLRAIENVDTDPKLALDMLKTLNKRYKQQILLQQTIIDVKLPNIDEQQG